MKRGTPRHPKVAHLCELLGVKIPTAVGYLELLWHFSAEFAPAGNIGKYSDEWIEAACHWHGRKGRLVAALIDAGWIDRDDTHRLVTHDWHEHADDSVKKRLARSQKQFVTGHRDSRKVTGQNQPSGGLPEPSQSHNMPEPSQSHTPPEPLPPPLRARRSPTAADIDRPVSEHFESWWARWCDLTGRVLNKTQAAQAWVSLVHAGEEPTVAACLESYGASDEVARGVVKNPDRWLFEQGQDRWQGRWPARRAPSTTTKQQLNADNWEIA